MRVTVYCFSIFWFSKTNVTMKKSSLGKRGTAIMPPPFAFVPEMQVQEERRGCNSKSMIPRPSRCRSASADRIHATPKSEMMSTMGILPCGSSIRSLGMQGKHCSKAKDPRLLTSKNFQTLALQQVVEYFSQHTDIDVGALKKHQITINQFVDLMIHLLSFFYPKIVLNMKNYTEKIPSVMKEMGYPSVVAKSWLLTVNTTHSWPQVLGLLSWLVDLVKFMCPGQGTHLVYSKGNNNILGSKRMLKYYMDCANRFNNGSLNDIDLKFRQEIIDKLGVSDEVFNQSNMELEHLKREIEKPERVSRVIELSEVKKERTKIMNEQQSLTQTIHERMSYEKELSEKKERLEVQIEKLKKENILLEKEVNCKTQLLDVQRCTVTRKKALEKELRDLEQEIKLIEDSVDLRNKELYKYDLKEATFKSNLNMLSSEYNILLRKNVNLCPELRDFDLKVTHNLQDVNAQIQRIENCVATCKRGLPDVESKWTEWKEEEARQEEERLQLIHENEKQAQEIADRELKLTHLNEAARQQEIKYEEKLRDLNFQIAELQTSMPDRSWVDKKLESVQENTRALKQHMKKMEEEAKSFFEEYDAIDADFAQSVQEHLQLVDELLK